MFRMANRIHVVRAYDSFFKLGTHMTKVGFEPTPPEGDQDLNLARLPFRHLAARNVLLLKECHSRFPSPYRNGGIRTHKPEGASF